MKEKRKGKKIHTIKRDPIAIRAVEEWTPTLARLASLLISRLRWFHFMFHIHLMGSGGSALLRLCTVTLWQRRGRSLTRRTRRPGDGIGRPWEIITNTWDRGGRKTSSSSIIINHHHHFCYQAKQRAKPDLKIVIKTVKQNTYISLCTFRFLLIVF